MLNQGPKGFKDHQSIKISSNGRFDLETWPKPISHNTIPARKYMLNSYSGCFIGHFIGQVTQIPALKGFTAYEVG